ncbi:TPA: hypothetical protein U2R10_003829 [Proteus mirabilis]|nr:hypothetical protein [Proteus mirabilis]
MNNGFSRYPKCKTPLYGWYTGYTGASRYMAFTIHYHAWAGDDGVSVLPHKIYPEQYRGYR